MQIISTIPRILKYFIHALSFLKYLLYIRVRGLTIQVYACITVMSYRYSSILSLICLLLGFSCTAPEEAEKEEKAKAAASATTVQATQVRHDTTRAGEYYYYIQGNGTFRPEKEIQYKAQAEGRVITLHGNTGSRKNAGQPLLHFDSKEATLSVEKARISLEKAQLEYENTLVGYPQGKANAATRDSLLQKLVISSGLAEARHELKQAESVLENTRLAAPFPGIMADLEVVEGSQVNAGDPLFTFYSNGNLLLDIHLLESDLQHVKSGYPAAIKPLSQIDNATAISGKIRHINPRVDENGQVKVVIETTATQNLIPGMHAEVTIKIPYPEKTWVPKDAVVLRSGRSVVFTIEGEKAKWNYVETGMDNGREVEILDGVAAGSLVVTSNNLQLAHDAPVVTQTNKN